MKMLSSHAAAEAMRHAFDLHMARLFLLECAFWLCISMLWLVHCAALQYAHRPRASTRMLVALKAACSTV